ncbi:MAG: response regulator [Anaerolineae bacterium]|nr:response regulator [Anaerolineae bacterium]
MPEQNSYQALIVDDNWFNRDVSAIALKHVGYSVTEASNARDALSLLEQHRFDLLVLDLAMPEMDGATMLRMLKERGDHRSMRVVVMTANPHMTTDQVDADADYVMFKPINIGDFAHLAYRLQEGMARKQ